MIKTTITSIAGIAIWYGFKIALYGMSKYDTRARYESIRSKLPYVLTALTSLGLSVALWLWPTCNGQIQLYASYSVIVSAVTLALDAVADTYPELKRWTEHPTDMLSPGHGACATVLVYISGAGVQQYPQSTCSTMAASVPVYILCMLAALVAAR